jgi:hypothetical protein
MWKGIFIANYILHLHKCFSEFRWTKQNNVFFNVFEKSKIYFTINIANVHWALAVIDMIEKMIRLIWNNFIVNSVFLYKKFRYYDSIAGGDRGERYLQGRKLHQFFIYFIISLMNFLKFMRYSVHKGFCNICEMRHSTSILQAICFMKKNGT